MFAQPKKLPTKNAREIPANTRKNKLSNLTVIHTNVHHNTAVRCKRAAVEQNEHSSLVQPDQTGSVR